MSQMTTEFCLQGSGKSWYAATRTDITLGCRAKLEATDLLDRWKSQLGCECRNASVKAAKTDKKSRQPPLLSSLPLHTFAQM